MKRLLSCITIVVLGIFSFVAQAKEVRPLQGGVFQGDLTVPPLNASDAQELTLEEATKFAVAQNFDIGIARLDRRIEERDLPIAKSIYDTQAEIDATYAFDKAQRSSVVLGEREIEGRVEVSLTKKISTGTTVAISGNTERHSTTTAFSSLDRNYTGGAEVSFEQPLLKNFFGYIDRKQIEQVKINIEKFDYETLERIEEVIRRVRNQYWDLVFAYENVLHLREDLRRAQDFLQITTKKMDLGLTEKPDQYAAESNVRKRVINVKRAETEWKNASHTLKVLLNVPEVSLIVPTQKPRYRKMQFDANREAEKALQNRRDLKALKLALEDQTIEMKIRKNERLPDLEFTGSYTTTGLDRKLSAAQGKVFAFERPQYFAGVRFGYPLENRAARGRFDQSRDELIILQKELSWLELDIEREVHESIRNLSFESERVKQTKEIKKLELSKLKEEEKNFNFGRSDSKTIIDFQEDLILAETNHIAALVDFSKAIEEFYDATDTLIEKAGLSERPILEIAEEETP